jgi:hypothetical protein
MTGFVKSRVLIYSVLSSLHCECQPVQHIPPSRDGRELRRIVFAETGWQCLHSLIIVDREEKWNTVSLLRRTIDHSVHSAFVYSVRPTH